MRLYITVILCTICKIGVKCDAIVETEGGKVRGTILKSNLDRNIYSFMGVPYAEPPVKQLRFEPPIAKLPWKDILNCTKIPPVCIQEDYFRHTKITGSEDCLYLNIYTTKLQSNHLLPVMILIHAGAFSIHSGNLNHFGPHILLDKNIVLATINYRLGPLGFLSTQDEVVLGNNGLKDQHFAIKWINRNIHNFGGDPSRIIIFGQSVGGTSVHFHMLSPLSRGLFHGAISESGTALSLWALDTNSANLNNSKKLAIFLNCPNQPSQVMIDCLRNVDAFDIVKSNRRFSKWDIDPTIRFMPVIEPNVHGAFLTQHPIDIIRSGKLMEVPWIVGSSTEEGSIRAAGIYSKPLLVKQLNNDFNHIAPILFVYPKNDSVTSKIREFYFQKSKINNAMRRNFINMYSDGRYFSSIHEAVRVHLKYTNSPIYYYLFGYKGGQSFSKTYGGGSENYGVCHGDEFLYLSHDPLIAANQTDVFDQYYTELMSTLWTNFAKTLNPSIDAPNQVIPSTWYPATVHDMDCYYIGHDVHMAQNLRGQRAQFWKSLHLHPSNSI